MGADVGMVVLVSLLVQLGIHHIPATQELFQIGDLPLADCALAFALGLVPVSVLELSKLIRRSWTVAPKPANAVS